MIRVCETPNEAAAWMNSTSLGDLVDLLVVVRNALVQVLEFLVEPVQLGAKALTEPVLGLLEDLR